MFENPRRGRQAKHFATNVPKILGLKSSSVQIFSENCRWVPLLRLVVQNNRDCLSQQPGCNGYSTSPGEDSFRFSWNWNSKYVNSLPKFLEWNHTRFQTKMGKIYTVFRPNKRRKNYTLWGVTSLYGLYHVGVLPPTSRVQCDGKIILYLPTFSEM